MIYIAVLLIQLQKKTYKRPKCSSSAKRRKCGIFIKLNLIHNKIALTTAIHNVTASYKQILKRKAKYMIPFKNLKRSKTKHITYGCMNIW